MCITRDQFPVPCAYFVQIKPPSHEHAKMVNLVYYPPITANFR